MKSKHTRIAVWAFGMASAPCAWAQSVTPAVTHSSPEDTQAGIDEIIVTARRREERLLDTPVAVAVVSGKAIDDMQIRDGDSVQKLPGVMTSPSFAGASQNFTISIRGQGTGFATGEDSVIPYFAEVANFQVGFFDLENVQVIKGPQGTLFGETATGGVLLYGPRKPADTYSGYLRLQGGSHDLISVEAAVGGPIVEDKILFRAAMQYRKRDGYVRTHYSFGAPDRMAGNVDTVAGRLALTIKPVASLEIYTMYATSRNRSNGSPITLRYVDTRFLPPALANLPIALVPSLANGYRFFTGTTPPPGATYASLLNAALARQLAAGPYQGFTNYNQSGSSRFHGIVNQIRWEIADNVTLRNIFGLSWVRSNGITAFDVDGTDLPLLDVRSSFAPGTTDPNIGNYADIGGWPSRTLSEEAQLLGTLLEGRLQWQAGFYYRERGNRDFRESQGAQTVFGAPQGDPAPAAVCAGLGVSGPCSVLQRDKAVAHAGYGQITYALLDTLNITAGYRSTWSRAETEVTAATPYLVGTTALRVPGRDPIANAIVNTIRTPRNRGDSYNLTLDWKPGENTLVYAAHRRGYKSGGINLNQLPGATSLAFDPETIEDIEIGAKSTFRMGSMRGGLNIALFKSWYSDIQRSQAIPGTATTFTANVAKGIIKGIDIDGFIAPTNWLRLSGSVNYLHARYRDWFQNSTCASLQYLPQCRTLPAGTPAQGVPATIDHVRGILTVGDTVYNFRPDLFGDAPKWSFSIQPAISLKELVGEEIDLSANIYHRSRAVNGAAAANYSAWAGVTLPVVETVFGPDSTPVINQAYTRVDARIDWRKIGGSSLSAAVFVTNLTKQVINRASANAFANVGVAYGVPGEPRMWGLELGYEF